MPCVCVPLTVAPAPHRAASATPPPCRAGDLSTRHACEVRPLLPPLLRNLDDRTPDVRAAAAAALEALLSAKLLAGDDVHARPKTGHAAGRHPPHPARFVATA